jgi:hypothetical protein
MSAVTRTPASSRDNNFVHLGISCYPPIPTLCQYEQRLPAEGRPQLENAQLIGCMSRSAAAVWPVHPQRSCYWHSLQGQSRRSGSGLRRQQGLRFSSEFSPSVMSSAPLRTAGCVHQRLKDQTSMGFIHGLVRASAHNPHSHRMKDIDDGCCGSPPDLDGAGGCEASGKDRTGDQRPPA